MLSHKTLALPVQAFACTGLAATILAVAYATAPNATDAGIRITHVFAHEVGHLIGAAATGHSWVNLEIGRNSGHVITRGGPETVGLVIMGPLFPAILAALALTLGMIQRWNATFLATIGLAALVAAILGGPYDQAVDWTLYGLAGLGFLSLAPLWPWMRAVLTLGLGMVLSIGVLQALRHFGHEAPDPDHASDALQLAMQWAPSDPVSALGDVRAIIIGLTVLIYLTTAIIARNLLLIQNRTSA